MSVIHILGIQGSGKSYIGELIKKKLGNRVAICEVDDFYRDVYNEYSRLDKLVNAPQLTKRAEKNITLLNIEKIAQALEISISELVETL